MDTNSILPNRDNLPWLSKSLIRKKEMDHLKQARSTKDPTVGTKYRATRNGLVAILKKVKSEYFFQRLDPGNCNKINH